MEIAVPRTRAFSIATPPIVPDNLKAGVLKANWHEPGLNPTYQDFATHYGTAILPARPRRPRDKAKSLPSRKRGSKSRC